MISQACFGELEAINIDAILTMFDGLNDIAFFVKDREGRYFGINRTMVRRCGARDKDEVIGKTALDLFPQALAETYFAQDRKVIDSGASIDKHLELHIYPGRSRGWCITRKMPLQDTKGRIIGLIGTSRDLGLPDDVNPAFRQIAHIAEYIRENYQRNVCVKELADQAGLSLSQVSACSRKSSTTRHVKCWFNAGFRRPRRSSTRSRTQGSLTSLTNAAIQTTAPLAASSNR